MKIQRLVTPQVLQRKRHRVALKKRHTEASKQAAADYAKLMAHRVKEQRERKEELRKRRASSVMLK